jgi:hypothetical protein
LLGERTFELARDAIEVEPVEPLSLKGKAGPVAAYNLVRVVEGAPAFERRLDTPLVGRRDELARLRDAFDRVVSDRVCRLVTVVGPPASESRASPARLPRTSAVRRQFSRVVACPTERASPTGRFGRSSPPRGPRTSSTLPSLRKRRRRSSGKCARCSNGARAGSRSSS